MNLTTTEQNYTARQQARAFSVSQLHATHPKLVRAGTDCNSLIAATKNIRIELKAAFPGVKFGIRSSRFAGGNSIDVSWIDGPTDAMVDAVVGRYSGGTFDGMTDCYNYDNLAWTDAFGEAKYIHTRRDYSDAVLEQAIGNIYDLYRDKIEKRPAAWDYRQGLTWNIRLGDFGDDTFQTYMHRELSKMVVQS